MDEFPPVDITDYLYQKLSYYIIFNEEINDKVLQFETYLKSPLFWKNFHTELSFLLSRHCLLEPEITRIYYVLGVIRTLDLDPSIWNIINDCIVRMNTYKIDMDIEYYDGFYITEMRKRFPNMPAKLALIEDYVPVIQGSLVMDFPLLWSLIIDDEELFVKEILPSIDMTYPFINNLNAFAFEVPELFSTEIMYHRLSLLVEKLEKEIKQYSMMEKIPAKRLLKQYKEYLK